MAASTRPHLADLCTSLAPASNSNLDSDSEGSEFNIPPSASVRYVSHKSGTPGLQINTNKTREWVLVITSVASRTRSKFKT